MGFAIFVLLLTGLIIFIFRKTLFRKEVVRRLSVDRARHETTRIPVTGKCPCGMPRCRYKGRKHPSATFDEAPLRNRHKHGG